MFFCLITGSQSFEDYPKLCERLDYFLHNKQEVVLAVTSNLRWKRCVGDYARSRKISCVEFKQDISGARKSLFKTLSCVPENGCVCFWDGLSKGTADNIKLSAEYRVPCRVVRF